MAITMRISPFIQDEWYMVAYRGEIGRSLLQRTVVGRRIVLFRTLAGEAIALDGRCAHRSYPLSAGKLDGDTVVCGYHGLRFDRAGDCVEVPSLPTCPKGIGVHQYPLVERGPFAWGWFGAASQADASRIPRFGPRRASTSGIFKPRRAMNHLLSLPHVSIEDRECIVQALSNCGAGLEFADALHHASYRSCESITSFDDKRFARRVRRLGLSPRVIVPSK